MSEEGAIGDSGEGLPIFEEFIREKWKSFSRSYHLYLVLIPHIVCLSAYMILLVVRITAVYECRIELEFPRQFRLAVTSRQYNDSQLSFCPICLGINIPFLSWHAWQEMRIKAIDFNPNQDFAFSAQELIISVLKNLGSLLKKDDVVYWKTNRKIINDLQCCSISAVNFSCAIAKGLQLGFWYESCGLSELDWPELETDDIDSTLDAVVSSNKALEHFNRE